jgi:hypothetical protein
MIRTGGPAVEARGSLESRSPCAVWECAVRPSPLGSPGPDRDSRCVARAGEANAHHERRRSAPRSPFPSSAERQSRSSRARNRRRPFLHERAKVHHLIGHQRFLCCIECCNPILRGITDDHRKRALVEGALREWLASAQLHHQLGHDPDSGTTREIDLQSVFEPVPGATIFRMKNQARSIIASLSRLNRNRECVLGAGVLE